MKSGEKKTLIKLALMAVAVLNILVKKLCTKDVILCIWLAYSTEISRIVTFSSVLFGVSSLVGFLFVVVFWVLFCFVF